MRESPVLHLLPRLPALLVVLNLVVMTCSAPPAPPPLVRPPPPPPRVDPPRVAPPQPAPRDDFARGWALWTAGHRDEALAVLRPLVHGEAQKGAGSNTIVSINQVSHRIVAAVGHRTYWFDAAGRPLQYDATDADTLSFVVRSPLTLLSGSKLALVDSTTLEPLLRVANVERGSAVSETGNAVVYQDANSRRLHLWDVATRSDRRVFELRDGERCVISWTSPDGDEVGCRYSTRTDEWRVALFDAAGGRLDYPSTESQPTYPVYSTDNKWIAYGIPPPYPTPGATILVDRATRTVITTSATTFPTSLLFSKDNTLLIVGELRRLSILDVPSLRVHATTPFLRDTIPSSGDDLQNITDIEILGNDRAFWAVTADGTNGVFSLPSGAEIWSGDGAHMLDARGRHIFNGTGETDEMVTIDAKLHVHHRPLTPKDRAWTDNSPEAASSKVLESTVCTVDDRIYPIAACRF